MVLKNLALRKLLGSDTASKLSTASFVVQGALALKKGKKAKGIAYLGGAVLSAKSDKLGSLVKKAI